MGTYITVTDQTAAVGTPRLSLLTEGTAGTVSTSIANVMIGYAEAEANSILGPGFSVPFTSAAVTTVIKRCCVDIAVHFCYTRLTEFRRSDGNTPVFREYEDARNTLQDIRDGKRTLGATGATNKSALTGAVVYNSVQNFIIDDGERDDGPSGGF